MKAGTTSYAIELLQAQPSVIDGLLRLLPVEFTGTEQKMLLYLLLHMDNALEGTGTQVYELEHLCNACGILHRGAYIDPELQATLMSLADKSDWETTGEGRGILNRLMRDIDINRSNGLLFIEFHDSTFQQVDELSRELKKQFNTFFGQ